MPVVLPPTYFASYCFSPQSKLTAIQYNTSSMAWSVTAAGAPFVTINTSDPDQTAILMNGAYVMFIWKATGAIGVGEIKTKVIGGDYPRLEFYRQTDPVPRRFASLSQNGRLSVTDWSEKIAPTGTDRMYLLTANASIGIDGLLTPSPASVRQMGLLTAKGTGNYLADESGLLLSRK